MTESKNTEKEPIGVPTNPKKGVKLVRNRSGHKIELAIDGKVVVFPQGESIEVPADFDIPNGLGLHVR